MNHYYFLLMMLRGRNPYQQNKIGSSQIKDNAITARKIADGSIDLTTKAVTLTGLTLTDAILNKYPLQYSWLMSNVAASQSRPIPPLSGATNTVSTLIAALSGTIVGYTITVRSVDYYGTENVHAEAGYTAWTTGTIGLEIQTSSDGVNPMATVTTLVSGLTKATVAAYSGRFCKFKLQGQTPVTVTAGTEIICKVTTSADFNGTALDLVATVYGRLSDA